MLPEKLIALVGKEHVLTDGEPLDRRALDTWPLPLVQQVAGRQPAAPVCAVLPGDTDELSRVMSLLHTAGVAVVPRGGGSGVGGGAMPPAGAVVVDLSRLDRIGPLDDTNLTVTAGAGVKLAALEAWLNERGYICGHYPQSIADAQLGGLVATRSAGQFSTKYGNIEDVLVGLGAVLPDGRRVAVRDLPRRSVGPDLRHVWLGSEGAWGVITEVTLRIFPRPESRWLAAYAFTAIDPGLAAIRRFMQAGWRPAVVRLHDETEAERSYPGVAQAGESILLLLSEGPPAYVAAESGELDRLVRGAGGRPLGEGPVVKWLEHRNDVHLFGQLISMGLIVDTIEVAAGWDTIGDIYRETLAAIRGEVPEVFVISGHSSHSYMQGTNLYFTLAAQPKHDPADMERVYRAIWSRVMTVTRRLGGTICHHHGIGRLRAQWVPDELGSGYPVLAAIKAALDPQGQMNPGALLPGPSSWHRTAAPEGGGKDGPAAV